MASLDAKWMADSLGASWAKGEPKEVAGVCFDSRAIKTCEIFVALKGARHGHEFVEVALSKGASGAIVEELQAAEIPQMVVSDSLAALQKLAAAWRQAWGHEEASRRLCAITGSAGKTSTKELLAHLLGERTHKTEGNFNNHIGLPVTLLKLGAAHTHAVVECGVNHMGEMDPLADMAAPDAALLTNIGSAHLEFFKTQSGIANEKGKLLQAVGKSGVVVIHASELKFAALQKLTAKVVALGKKPAEVAVGGNYHFIDLKMAEVREGWEIEMGGEKFRVGLWTPGMVQNAALTIALARKWGVSAADIQVRLESWKGVALRGNWAHFEGSPSEARVWFDAYNANPEAMADSLWKFQKTAREGKARLYIVGTMGELGEKTAELHRQTGALVKLGPRDEAWTVGEKAVELAQGLKEAGAKNLQIKEAATLDEIRARLATFDGEVFIKGSHSTGLYTLGKLLA